MQGTHAAKTRVWRGRKGGGIVSAWMKSMKNSRPSALLALGLLLVALQVPAATTYYIDYTNGSDSNNGTSTSTPWKRCPYMVGFAGNYSHSGGDKFIFKGGTVWPYTTMPIKMEVGGTASAYDYYGSDSNYFAGSTFTQPVLDAGQTSTDCIRVGWSTANLKYITINNFEMRNMSGSLAISLAGANYIVMSNLWIHKWYHGSTDGDHGGIYNNYAGHGSPGQLANVIVSHCDIGNPDGGRNSGVCCRGVGEIAFSKLHDAPEQSLHGGWSIHDSEFYNNVVSFLGDAAQHPNVCYWDMPDGSYVQFTGDVLFYNNYIHDMRGPGLPVIYVEAAFSTPLPSLRRVFIYNNVVMNCASAPSLPDNEGFGGGSTVEVHFFNNTFETSFSTCINSTSHGGPNFSLLDLRNNHFIVDGSASSGSIFNSTTSSAQLTQSHSQASAAGYSASSMFAPPSASAATVGAGANLSSWNLPGINYDTSRGGTRTPKLRPATGNWDSGAYAYNGTSGGGGGTAGAPTVSAVAQNATDVDPNVSGLQVYVGTTVQYSGTATTTNTGTLSWQWVYTVNGGSEVTFASGTGTVTPASYTYPSGSVGAVYVWTLRATDSKGTSQSQSTVGVESTPPPPGTLTFQAESGTLSGPFVASGGSISQSSQTGVTDGGRAAFSFTLTNAGDYVIQATVNAPSDAENSLYVNIDGEPVDPANVWQIPITSGFESLLVSWQGNGTFDNPQFVPKVFTLTAGTHQVIFRGREANTQLDSFSIVKLPSAPQNLRVIAGP